MNKASRAQGSLGKVKGEGEREREEWRKEKKEEGTECFIDAASCTCISSRQTVEEHVTRVLVIFNLRRGTYMYQTPPRPILRAPSEH